MGVNGVIITVLLFGISVTKSASHFLLEKATEDYDQWAWANEDRVQNVAGPHQLLSMLCTDYYLTIDNQEIDCWRLRLKIKEDILDELHDIRRRDVDDTFDEGSGDHIIPFKEEPDSVDAKETEAELPESEDAKEVDQTEDRKITVATSAEASTTKEPESVKEPKPSLEEPLLESQPEVVESPVRNESKIEDSSMQAAEKHEEADAKIETTTEALPRKVLGINLPEKEGNGTIDEDNAELNKGNDQQSTDSPKEQPTSPEQIISTSFTPLIHNATPEPTNSSSTILEPEAPQGSTNAPKEAEAIDNSQSGNAVVFKQPNAKSPGTIEASESDKHLETNAEISNGTASNVEQPNSRESIKTASTGKDTTILIVLFAIVVVIGAGALTHHFIKKRKQGRENSDVVNGIRKSLQNLSVAGKPNQDVEAGTEMKPLMKSPVKEYSDKTQNNEA